MILAQEPIQNVAELPAFIVGPVEMRYADGGNPSMHDPTFMDELNALSESPLVWARRVEPDEANGFAPGRLWVMYSDGSGLYMRVLTNASFYWESAPQAEVDQLGAFVLAGLHQVKVLSPFGVVGHA